ncbi:MAG: hypothetical protein AAB356_01355, partial [Deltaproteobacteria bacterium]
KLTAPQWFGIFIIFIMVSSTGGFILSYGDQTPTTTTSYNGFDFTTTAQGYYQLTVQGKNYLYEYHPTELTDVEIPQTFLSALETKKITITYDAQSNETLLPLLARQQYFLEQAYTNQKYSVTHAIHKGSTPGIPEKSCSDAEPSNPVIYLTTGENDIITTERETCLVVTVATPQELLKVSEYLSYNSLGVLS